MEIARASIVRLARKSGVKSISDDCLDLTRAIMCKKLDEIIRTVLIVNDERQTKTLMPEDVYEALSLLDNNLARTTEMGTSTCSK